MTLLTIPGLMPLGQTAAGGTQLIEAAALILIFLVIVMWIGGSMAKTMDKDWLPRLIVWGFFAKMAGSLARFWMVTILYGSGDSFDYHDAGQLLSTTWRSFAVPVSTGGGEGTAFTEVIAGFVYAIYTPTFLGAFLIWAFLAFLGQLLFLAAFRHWFGEEKRRLYTLAVLFLPSLVFWPSSLGKDALMVFFLGLAAYGSSRLLRTYKLTSVVPIGIGLLLAAGIRPHVSAALAIALVLALILGKPLPKLRGSPMRPVVLVAALAGAVVVLGAFSTTFEVGVSESRQERDLGGFLEDVSDRTSTGGSQIEGAAVSTPAQLPGAVITVMFRPLLYEGANPQMIMSALEGTALLVFTVWKLPQMWRNKGLLRRKAYMTMCFLYTGGFIIGFSAILNLGILARQRVQVLPMFLAFLVAMAWPEPEETESSGKDHPSRPGLTAAAHSYRARLEEPATGEDDQQESTDGQQA
ncbi:MAG TPA: hypothetical protein VK969_01530 [Acidimicrobiia bacterium]|nr:hypothetical protein [Acidimicrobiia bacterium]